MTNTAHKQYGVLTADIVHSTKLDAEDYASVMQTLQKLLTSQAARYQCKFEIFRGDSFQILYTNIIDAMNSVLSIRLYLQSGIECPAIKLTQSIAIGRVEQASSNLSSSLGEAFILSGRALDKAARGDLVINFGNDLCSTDLSISTLFLHHLLTGLTEKQAEVLYYYIEFNFPEQQVIADHMNVTRQNVATHLKRSGAELVRAYLVSFRETCLGTPK
nr:hypothetical protein [uncultured Glaciecola sp.]